MPLDTSIALGVQAPQIVDPSKYAQLAAEQQMNALRAQVMQQTMQQNALQMQYTQEDRARAEAGRRQSAAEKAQEKALRQRILQESGGDATKASSIALSLGRPDIAKSYAEGRESIAKANESEADLEKKAFANSYQKNAAYAPLIANGAIPGRAVVGAIFDDPIMGGVLSRVMTRDEAMAYADKDPQGLAQILATPPDKIYDAVVKPPEFDIRDTAQGTVRINKATGQAEPITIGGAPVMPKPSAQQEKAAIQTKQLAGSIDTAISTLEELVKPKSLLDESTASGAGAMTDAAAGFFGYATPGSVAASKLKVLADPILKMIPRFEGPQSDKDTQSYKEAAGELGNEYLPAARRKAAAETILKLFKKRRDQFTSSDLPEAAVGTSAGGFATPTATPSGASVSNW